MASGTSGSGIKKYQIGDRIKLKTGETVEVAALMPCGPMSRRDMLYAFERPTFTLTGRELMMNAL